MKEAKDLATGEHVAIKIFKKWKMNFQSITSAHREYDLMTRLDHPSILPIKGFFEDTTYICLVSPLMQTNMYTYLYHNHNNSMSPESTRQMTENKIRILFYKMTDAVILCHNNGIIHRDVKLDNYLVDLGENEDDITIRLGDFGLACQYNKEDPPTTMCGSLPCVAPDVLRK